MLSRERYVLMGCAPVVRKENEDFTSYVVLPQYFDLKAFLVQRYKQDDEYEIRSMKDWTGYGD